MYYITSFNYTEFIFYLKTFLIFIYMLFKSQK